MESAALVVYLDRMFAFLSSGSKCSSCAVAAAMAFMASASS